jgi:protein involved in polysaccharide export with SLBB domain
MGHNFCSKGVIANVDDEGDASLGLLIADFRKSMKPGKDRLSWKAHTSRRARGRRSLSLRFGQWGVVVATCVLFVGCVHQARQHAGNDTKSSGVSKPANSDREIAESYQVGCPDELTIEVSGKAGFTTRKMVGPDGRIELGNYGKPRVEGRSPAQIAELLAADLAVPRDMVRVRVAEYSSRQLFLFGPIAGKQQSFPYKGQETVLEFLQRTSAFPPDKHPADVYVVRAHIVEDGRPEVFHIDLTAITDHHDLKTNVRLLPNDQIYLK